MIHLGQVLLRLEEAVNTALNKEARTKPPAPTPPYIVAAKSFYPHGHVWEESADLAWRFCEQTEEFLAATPGGTLGKVVTSDFGKRPEPIRLANHYFDLVTGKTVSSSFIVGNENECRSGDRGEDIFIDIALQLDALEKAIEMGTVDVFFELNAIGEGGSPSAVKPITKAETEEAARTWINSWGDDKPTVPEREKWYENNGITRARGRELVKQLAPEHWSAVGKPRTNNQSE